MKKLWLLFPLGLLSLTLIALIPACSSTPSSPAATPTPVPPIPGSPTPTPTITPTNTPTNTSTLTPTNTPSSTATNSPTPTATPTVAIVWAYPSLYKAGASQDAFVQILVNGLAPINAAVTLSGTFPGAPVALPYNGYVTHGGVQYANYETTGFTYQVNTVYTLTTIASGQTASSSVTAPGGLTVMQDTNSAVTLFSWTSEGSLDQVHVYETAPTPVYTYNSTNLAPDIDSPVTLADSGGGNLYPGGSGSTYSVFVGVRNEATSTAGGSVTLSANLYAEDYLTVLVSLP